MKRQTNADPYSIAYSSCPGNCESPSTQWVYQHVETSADVDLANPIPPNIVESCTMSQWVIGYWGEYPAKRPSLALDAAGNARIGYDVVHVQSSSTFICPIHVDGQLVRFAQFGTGGGTVPNLNQKGYLPLTLRNLAN